MIVRGTTPYHSFILPIDIKTIDKVYVTYTQNGKMVLDKSNESGSSDFSMVEWTIGDDNGAIISSETEIITDEEPESETQITIHLSQEDTLKFTFFPAAEKNIVIIQIRVLLTDGEAFASDPIHERVLGVLKDGVIGDLANEDEPIL